MKILSFCWVFLFAGRRDSNEYRELNEQMSTQCDYCEFMSELYL